MVNVKKLRLTEPNYWGQKQLDDDDTGPIIRAKEQDSQPGWVDISDQSRELKILWDHWDSLRIDHGTLHRIWKSEDDQTKQLQVGGKDSVFLK